MTPDPINCDQFWTLRLLSKQRQALFYFGGVVMSVNPMEFSMSFGINAALFSLETGASIRTADGRCVD